MASSIITDRNDNLLGRFIGVNINSVGGDSQMVIPYSKYIVRRIAVTNASKNLGASVATIGLFTGAGATGTTVAATGLLTALTGATKFVDLTVTETDDTLTSANLYVNNVVADGGVATVDVYVFGDVLA